MTRGPFSGAASGAPVFLLPAFPAGTPPPVEYPPAKIPHPFGMRGRAEDWLQIVPGTHCSFVLPFVGSSDRLSECRITVRGLAAFPAPFQGAFPSPSAAFRGQAADAGGPEQGATRQRASAAPPREPAHPEPSFPRPLGGGGRAWPPGIPEKTYRRPPGDGANKGAAETLPFDSRAAAWPSRAEGGNANGIQGFRGEGEGDCEGDCDTDCDTDTDADADADADPDDKSSGPTAYSLQPTA